MNDLAAAAGRRLPYPTVVAFARALALLEADEIGVRVDRALLRTHGFAANAVGPVLDALRFAGLIDAGGVLRRPARDLAASPSALAREAIRPLLLRLEPPYPDRRALSDALRPLVDMSDTTLPLGATFLVHLAERAGIDLVVRAGGKPGARPGVPKPRRSAASRTRAGVPPPVVPRETPGAAPARIPSPSRVPDRPPPPAGGAGTGSGVHAAGAGDAAHGPAGVTFQLVVDRQTTRADIERMVREVREAMGRLQRT